MVGQLTAELITNVGGWHNNDLLQLCCSYTRHTCITAFFSRLRKLNPESSYSVLG